MFDTINTRRLRWRPALASGERLRVKWLLLTTLAWFFIGLLLAATGNIDVFFWDPALDRQHLFLLYLEIGLLVGLLQWIALRGQIPNAAWWIAATVLGTAVGALLSFTIGDSLGWQGFWLIDMLFIAPAVGIAQGAVLYNPLQPARWLLWPLLKLLMILPTIIIGTLTAFFIGGTAGLLVESLPLPAHIMQVVSGATTTEILAYGLFLSGFGFAFGLFTSLCLSKVLEVPSRRKIDADAQRAEEDQETPAVRGALNG